MKVFNILILIWFFVGCNNQNKENLSDLDLRLNSELYTKIEQSNMKFQGIKHFDLYNNDVAFVTYNPNKAFIKSKKKDSLIELETDVRLGLKNPSLINVYNNRIFVWDSEKLKFFLFDLSGVFIKTLKSIDKGVKDFVIYNKKVYFMFSGGHNKLLGVYDLQNEKIENEYVRPTNEHYVIETNTKSGFIRLINQNIYFPDHGRKGFYKYSLSNEKFEFVSLDLKQYEIKKVNNYFNLISNKEKLINYLSNNSMYYDVINIEGCLGLIATNDETSKKNNYARKKTIYKIDTIDNKKISAIKLSKQNHRLYSIGNIKDSDFYFVKKKIDSTKMSFKHSIHKLLLK